MKQGITHVIRSNRLDLTDLLEISDLLLRNQTFRFRVASWSMYPTLWKGDQITVEPSSPASHQVGDLLLFHDHGRLICHRLVALQETGDGPRLITKGDAATRCDAPLQPEQVLGRVVAVRSSWHWAGRLPKRIDCWLARLRDEVAHGLLALQGLRSYRRIMRSFLSPSFAFYLGVPEGSRWISYQPISRGGDATLPKGHRDFHLLAKLAGTCVGSLRVTASGEGYWIDHLYVQIRYRGLGVGSQLLTFACHLASRSGAASLLATVEVENSATLSLFDKMGFRPHTGSEPCGTAVLCRDLPR